MMPHRSSFFALDKSCDIITKQLYKEPVMNQGRILFLAIAVTMLASSAGAQQMYIESPGPMPQTGFFSGSTGTPGSSGGPGLNASPMESYGAPAQPGTHLPAALSVPITSNKAIDIIRKYLAKTNNEDLYPAHLFEYNTHFETELREKDTQRGAFELIIDKFTGRIYPETGPNLSWNNKYGINSNYFGIQPKMTLSVVDALGVAGDFIKRTSPELKVEGDATEYYGYYEFHITQDGKLAIEANVNGFTGQLWIENWHGPLLREAVIKNE